MLHNTLKDCLCINILVIKKAKNALIMSIPNENKIDILSLVKDNKITLDMILNRKNHFNNFLTTIEKIPKSTLSNRLKKLIENNIQMKIPDETHKQKKQIFTFSKRH